MEMYLIRHAGTSLAVAQRGHLVWKVNTRKGMSATHKQHGTLERNRFCRSHGLTKCHCLCSAFSIFPYQLALWSEMSLLCFLNDACDILVRARSQEWDLIRLWTHQGSQWAPENEALCSDRRSVCLHSNYTDCSSAMVDTSTHGGFTMEETNRWTPLLNKSSGHIVLFVMLSWTSEISQTGHHMLNRVFFFLNYYFGGCFF